MRDVLIVLVVLAVAALLFLAAVVATQEGDVLVDVSPDGPDVELPSGRVVAEDLRSVRFGMVFRGYRMSEVDAVLERLSAELSERDERIADLEQALVDVVEPAVQEIEAQQAGAAADGAPEPALPPSLAPPLALGARDGEAPPDAPASDAAEVEAAGAPEPVRPPSLAPPLALGARDGEAPPDAPAPGAAGAESAREGEAPADAPASDAAEVEASEDAVTSWQPSAVERTLDLAASYRFSMPHSVPVPQAETVVEPAGSEAPPAVEEPEPEEDDLGFPEVEPAEPAPPWTPEARDDTGDDDRGQPRPSTEP